MNIDITFGVLICSEVYEITPSNVPAELTGDRKVDRLLGFEGSFG